MPLCVAFLYSWRPRRLGLSSSGIFDALIVPPARRKLLWRSEYAIARNLHHDLCTTLSDNIQPKGKLNRPGCPCAVKEITSADNLFAVLS